MLNNSTIVVEYKDMRNEKYLTISYILAIAYIIAAYFFSGWSFHMVPHKNIDGKAILDALVCIYLLILGVLLLVSSLGITHDKSYGYKLYKTTFWFGLITLVCVSIGGAVIILKDILLGTLQIGSIMGLFYLPMAILYLSQRRKI